MLCFSGFELYSRWVPHVILRQPRALTSFGISFVPTVCTQSNVVTLVVKRKRLA